MRRIKVMLVLAALVGGFGLTATGPASAVGPNDTGPVGLSAMSSSGWNDLPNIHTQVISGELTSTDRHDANDDGFTGNGFYATESNGDKTIASIQGPGEITKMFFAGVWPTDTQLKIYLDGSSTPNVNVSFGYFFAGTNAPYVSPLVVPPTASAGAFSSYLPIPFAQSVKVDITLSPSNQSGASSVYGVDYQKYPPGTSVQSFNPNDTNNATQNAVNSIWNARGSDPKQPTNNYAPVTGTVTVPSNSSATIFNGSGPAQINAIKLTIPGVPGSATTAYSKDLLNNLRLRIFWDGEAVPSVDAPLGTFFGTGLFGAANAAKAVPFGFDGTSFYMYLPMPFASSAKVQLYSDRSTDTAGVSYTVLDAPFAGSFTGIGYLHTQYRFTRARSTDPFDYVALSAVGSGRYVGVETSGSGNNAATGYNDQAIHWMEGDAHIYVDGSRSPQWNGTGTEDYFGGAGYFCCGNGSLSYPANQGGFSYFTNALNGFTAHEFPTSASAASMTGNMAMYRMQPNDGVPFHRSITVSFEHGGGIRPVTPASGAVPLNANFQNQDAEAWTLAFYYYQPTATSQLDDTLNVGDSTSEANHTYSVSGGVSSGVLTHTWEGNLDAVPASLNSRTLSGFSQFTMAISPSNQGVILRRTFDQSSNPMSASVYVGGSFVGTWSYPGTNPNYSWRDDDFLIPATYTSGLSSITIKVVKTGSANWTESRYRTYSLVPPTSIAQPFLSDGAVFQISSLASHLDLDVSGGSTTPGAGVVQTTSLGSADGQLWRAVALPTGNSYAFVNVNSGLVLGGASNAQATVGTWTGSSSQMWQLLTAPTAGYYIVQNVGNSSGGPSEVLDDANASTTSGDPIQQYTQTNSVAQQWRFEFQDAPPTLFPVTTTVSATPGPIQNGTVYTMNARVSGLNLDLVNGSPGSDGQLVQQYTPNSSCAQRWLFTQVAASTFTIATTCATNPVGQTLVLQDQGIGSQVAIKVRSGSSGSSAQQWRSELVKDGITDSYYRLVNAGDGNVLNICNSGQPGCQGTVAGTPAQVYTWDASTAALWRLQAEDTPTCSVLGSGCGRWYELSPKSNSAVTLDVVNGSSVPGSLTQVYTVNHSCAQEWRADYVVNGYYKLTNLCSNKVLGVVGQSSSSGAGVQIWDWNGTDAELWKISTAATGGYVTLTNKASGQALDSGASSAGTGVTQATVNAGSSSQQWKFALQP